MRWPHRWLGLVVALLMGTSGSAWAGAQSRGGTGKLYLQVAYANGSTDRGFNNDGDSVPLTDPAFLDDLTTLLAQGDGDYEETVFRLYAEVGILESLDAIVAVDWKALEKTYELGFPGLSAQLGPESSGFGDVSLGLAWNFLDIPLPLAAKTTVRFPTYSTDVESLNLVDVNFLDDEIPLGQGTTDLILGLAASSGPLLPFGFIDVEIAYELADLVDREFSDRFSWLTKIGGSYRGFGGALTAGGVLSTGNGDAPNMITQDVIFDPADRVTVLNDQEWLTVGGQLWYDWDGIGLQLSYDATVAGRNTVDIDRFSAAIFFQR